MKRRRLFSDTENCSNEPEIDETKLPAERLLKTRDLPSKVKPWEEVLLLPVDTGPSLKIAVMKCYPGPLTPGGALITVTNGVKELRPKAVFCVGFCAGLDQKVSLGDVAILARLRTYSSVKVTDSGIQERGIAVPLERNLLSLIKNADDGWKAPLKGSWEVKVWKDGVYLSGPEKIESRERRKELVRRFPDAIAIEMEGQGENVA